MRTGFESTPTGCGCTPSMNNSRAVLVIGPAALRLTCTSRLRVNDWPGAMSAAKPKATASTWRRSAGGVRV